jgi:hypothetical protein
MAYFSVRTDTSFSRQMLTTFGAWHLHNPLTLTGGSAPKQRRG